MTASLTLYTNPMSRGRTARWMLEETGQPYTTEIVQYADTRTAAFRAINPMGKIPVLRHGDAIVTETAAICAYLADAFPDATLAPPPTDPGRAAYYRWLFFAAGPLEAAMTNKALGFEIPAEKQRMAGYGCYGSVMDVLEQTLDQGAYLTGDQFTAADLYVGSHIGFGLRFNTIEARPAFSRYWQTVSGRPAQMRAAQLDDALMPTTQPASAA